MSTEKKKELTTEERIELLRKRREADPNYKPGPPKVEIKVSDLSKIETPQQGRDVVSLLAAALTPKDARLARRDIERRLKPINNTKIPPEINRETIKKLPAVLRSKTESGKARAEFLLECIQWEKENPEQVEDEKFRDDFYWSGKAIEDLSCWVGACEKDKTEIKQLFNMCEILFVSNLIQADDKLNITTAFFLSGYNEYCFELFNIILLCPFTRLIDRAECCKYLYHSDNEKYVPSIEKHLCEIIDSDINDDIRYESLACFVTTTGIASKYLSNPLPVGDVNQALLTRLFLRFIGTKCDLFYIIMACEFLLEQTFDTTIYQHVADHLLSIAEDKTRDNRTRADAADVLLNHSRKIDSKRAYEIIKDIGESGQNELEKHIYNNKENVHKLNDIFSKYIETNHVKYHANTMLIQDLCTYIEDIATDKDEDALFKIRQSLDRIMIEPTLHTARKVSTADILRLIKYIIDLHPAKEELEKRLLEELEDMANTCSSGHAKRLVNVMVGFTDELEGSIDIKDQFIANIKARIMAVIKLKGEDERDELLESMAGDKKLFSQFVEGVSVGLEKELYNEFVDEGWLSAKTFSKIYKETIGKLKV